ncbi:MAG: ABC transporter permease [Bacteroidales bacterium]|nr:ABC transporter permease [Bacteroidales bacterium]
MNKRTLLFIVSRLCFSKRNKGIVHIISLISLIGISVGSLALVIVLSVFNGFASVAGQMLAKENPPLLISAKEGKTFDEREVRNLLLKDGNKENTLTLVPAVEQTAMISFGDNHRIVKIIGTTDDYFKYNALDASLVFGKENFGGLEYNSCLVGIGLAMDLGLNRGAEKMNLPLTITVPRADVQEAVLAEDMLFAAKVTYSACFRTQSDLDNGYVLLNIDKARELLGYGAHEVTSLYDIPKPEADKEEYTMQRKTLLSGVKNIKAEDLTEQQPLYFRIVKSEKFAVYVILSFIIFIATINILSSLIILYIQKQRMNSILRACGLMKKDLKKIYFFYGMTINVAGCLSGIVLGLIFCFLQQNFGLIRLNEENFVVNAFPVKILAGDIIRIILIVSLIGLFTIRIISSRLKIT